jgi:uncharacterized protein (DUF433 family)
MAEDRVDHREERTVQPAGDVEGGRARRDEWDTLFGPIRLMAKSAYRGRITAAPNVVGGKPAIKGTRLAVEHVLEALLAEDFDVAALLKGDPRLSLDDLKACVAFAHDAMIKLTDPARTAGRSPVGLVIGEMDDGAASESEPAGGTGRPESGLAG